MFAFKERHLFIFVQVAFLVGTGCGEENLSHDSSIPSQQELDDDHYPGSSTETGNDWDTGGPYETDTEQRNSYLASCSDSSVVVPEFEEGEEDRLGESCKVTADCLAPLFCLKRICSAPGPREDGCNGIDVHCKNKVKECVNFQCVDLDERCFTDFDCPSGFQCTCASGGMCLKPKCRPFDELCVLDTDCGEDQICDFGSCLAVEQCRKKHDLRGTYGATSTMHLGIAGDSAVGEIISATQWIRDLLKGGGTFPGLSDIISDVIRTFLMYNVEDYQIELVLALIDLPDILEEVQLEHQITLDATCSEMYRGEMTVEKIILKYRGQEFSERPENIPSIGIIPTAEFSATVQCESIAIDEFYVDYLASGASRYATEVLVDVVTKGHYEHLEDALFDLIDCAAVANYATQALGIPGVDVIIEPACRLAVNTTTEAVTKALADKPSKAGWMKIHGEAEVIDDRMLESGHWYGRTLTGNFTGEFSGQK